MYMYVSFHPSIIFRYIHIHIIIYIYICALRIHNVVFKRGQREFSQAARTFFWRMREEANPTLEGPLWLGKANPRPATS